MTDGSVGVRLGRRIAGVAGATVRGVRELATASPSRFAVLVFSTLILVFTGLFSLPAASATGIRTPFADALFTAVSTICVTGLSTVDMATHWSPLGHVIVFIGVNVGAMGVLTLASILGLVISKRLGLRAKLIAAGDTNPLRAHGGPVNEVRPCASARSASSWPRSHCRRSSSRPGSRCCSTRRCSSAASTR
jgi:hypothetical protein